MNLGLDSYKINFHGNDSSQYFFTFFIRADTLQLKPKNSLNSFCGRKFQPYRGGTER